MTRTAKTSPSAEATFSTIRRGEAETIPWASPTSDSAEVIRSAPGSRGGAAFTEASTSCAIASKTSCVAGSSQERVAPVAAMSSRA